jgi:hypothetical protein
MERDLAAPLKTEVCATGAICPRRVCAQPQEMSHPQMPKEIIVSQVQHEYARLLCATYTVRNRQYMKRVGTRTKTRARVHCTSVCACCEGPRAASPIGTNCPPAPPPVRRTALLRSARARAVTARAPLAHAHARDPRQPCLHPPLRLAADCFIPRLRVLRRGGCDARVTVTGRQAVHPDVPV